MFNNKILRWVIITIVLLAVPFIAMQFSNEVNWDETDFALMAMIIFGFGMMYELLTKQFQKTKNKIIISVVLIVLFLLVWAELAVGVFGTPWAGS